MPKTLCLEGRRDQKAFATLRCGCHCVGKVVKHEGKPPAYKAHPEGD